MLGWQPKERLLSSLDMKADRAQTDEPFWNRNPKEFHHADQKRDAIALQLLSPGLRYAIHRKLYHDALEIGLEKSVTIDFSNAKTIGDGTRIHDGQLHLMEGVYLSFANSERQGPYTVQHLYDELADDLHLWFGDKVGIPERVWNKLDLGIRRRLSTHPTYNADKKVRAFAATRHENVNYI